MDAMNQILEPLQALVHWLVGGTVGTGENVVTYTGAVQSFLSAITESPLLMTFFVMGLVGMGIGIIRRLTSVN